MAGPRFCSNCGHPVVVDDARFCKDCGAALTAGIHFKRDLSWNPWLAAGLSVIPGLGQFYKGQHLYALLWLIGVVLSYTMGPFGLVLHLICIVNAAIGGALDFPAAKVSPAHQLPNRQ